MQGNVTVELLWYHLKW